MANVSTGPRPAASHSETAGSDSTSREPPATASATQPISGTWPVSAATAATRACARPKKCSEANSTANEGGAVPQRGPCLADGPPRRRLGVRGERQGASRLHQPRLRGDCAVATGRLPVPGLAGRLLAHPAVDAFPQQVGVAHVPGVLLDHVHEHLAQADRCPPGRCRSLPGPAHRRRTARRTAPPHARRPRRLPPPAGRPRPRRTRRPCRRRAGTASRRPGRPARGGTSRAPRR